MSIPSTGLLASDLGAGTVLCGRYRVTQKLADGAVASVYAAADEAAAMNVALKVLDPLRGADPVGQARFMREFEILSRLDHPGIARCFRMERHGDLDFLVLELVEGETLEARLARGRLPVDEATRIAGTLARTLEHCHQQGILHRDLKPANIVMHPERGPIVLDFGVAWFSSAANLTRTGAVVGSPQDLAPEVFASSLYDARADVYALGVILFEMLTGRPVHVVTGVAELALLHQSGVPPTPSSIRPDLPRHWDAVVQRAVAPRAEDRFATAGELARALKSRAVMTGRALQARLPCRQCRTSLVIDVPFCPGCGAEVAWDLTPGPYAVQMLNAQDIPRAVAWLVRRHRAALRTSPAMTSRRLTNMPVPLLVNASNESAEQVAAEAREAGCTVEVIRARAVIGARLRPSAATAVESVAAATLHYAAFMSVALTAFWLRAEFATLALWPFILAVLGVGVARVWVRRPLLRTRPEGARTLVDELAGRTRAVLRRLRTERARRLASTAVARAAAILVTGGTPPDLRRLERVRDELSAALDAVAQLDAHAEYLADRSRSRLAAQIEEARTRALHDAGAGETLQALEAERQALTDASLAHDLAARQVLERCEAITVALGD